MSDGLQPGDRILDLRAVSRSGGMFTGLTVAPLAAGLFGWWWGWCVLAAVGAAVAGFAVADAVGRVVFPAPPGQGGGRSRRPSQPRGRAAGIGSGRVARRRGVCRRRFRRGGQRPGSGLSGQEAWRKSGIRGRRQAERIRR
jgi:hypothetical protein